MAIKNGNDLTLIYSHFWCQLYFFCKNYFVETINIIIITNINSRHNYKNGAPNHNYFMQL